MELSESKCILWRVEEPHNLYLNLVQSTDSDPIQIGKETYYLSFELRAFIDEKKDSFILSLYKYDSKKTDVEPISVRTFIQDETFNVHFLQMCELNVRNMDEHAKTIIWAVERSAFKNYLDTSPVVFVDFVLLCGKDFVWASNLEMISKNKTRNNFEHKSIQTDIKINSSCMQKLSEDFCKLLKNDAVADVTLHCEDCKFPAHKAILSTRSSEFAELCQDSSLDKNGAVIEIKDVNPAVLELLLKYVYTGALCYSSDDSIRDLYTAARKYAISSLQIRCRELMKENLSESNACNNLVLADEHDDKNLKREVITFIISNKNVLAMEEWNKVCSDHPKVALEVYRILHKDIPSV